MILLTFSLGKKVDTRKSKKIWIMLRMALAPGQTLRIAGRPVCASGMARGVRGFAKRDYSRGGR